MAGPPTRTLSVEMVRAMRDEQRVKMLTLKRDIQHTETKITKDAFEFMPPDILPLENIRNIEEINGLLEEKKAA